MNDEIRILQDKLQILNDGEYHDTTGAKPRRIFPIDIFRVFSKAEIINV